MKSLALASVALLMLAACGTSDQGSSTSPTSKASVPEASSSAPSPSSTPTFRQLDSSGLKRALLPLSAAPVGYSVSPPTSNEDANKYFCDYKPPFEEQARVRRDFQKGAGLGAELLSVAIRQYDTVEHASAAFDALATTVAGCTSDTVNGQTLTYAQVNLAPVGEKTVGVRIEGPAFLLQGFSLVGPSILSAGAGSLTNADADLQARVLQQQVQLYESSAKQ